MQQKIKEYRKKELEFENKYKRKPTCEEISNITGYDQSTIQLIEANLSDSISYDAQINTDEDNSFLDLIPDKNKTPDEIYLEKSQKQILFKAINEAGLTARQKDVIQRRFGFNGKIQTLESIGNIYGLSRERVRIIEKNALTKLQKYFKRYVWQEDNNNLYSRTIYSYFKDYQEIEVNYAISILPEEYKNIIYFKFGKDLKHHNRLLSMNKERKFYNEILPKITEILERLYPHNKIKPNNKVNSKTFEILLNLFKMYPFN